MKSLECYGKLLSAVKYRGYRVDADDILKILEMITKELLIEGESGLLNHAVGKWISYCNHFGKRNISYIPERFIIRCTESNAAISPYDAWSWITFLADYLEDKVEERSLLEWSQYICRDYHSHEHRSKDVEKALMRINDGIVKRRIALYQNGNQHEKTERAASVREAEATKRVAALTHPVCEERFKAEQKMLSDGLGETSELLQKINQQMRQIEEMVEQTNTKKASRQLLELYNLIADVRDSESIQKANTPEMEYMADNFEIFLDIIVEYLAEYGIEHIYTAPGEAFNGKIHEVKASKNFDPRSTVIHKSIRSGFSWGDQVIQKEKVLLEI